MSKIEWTDVTWNPVVGCTPVSPGCLNCYAATLAGRLEAIGHAVYADLTVKKRTLVGKARATFNGTVRCLPDRLADPLHWRKPRMVFVNSMSDLFHEDVPFEFVDRVFAVMALCPRHTFQVLTKRPERMAEYLDVRPGHSARHRVGGDERIRRYPKYDTKLLDWPLPNVWLGVSAEDQQRLNGRWAYLARCPAAVRFLSCEPLLGPLNLMASGAVRSIGGTPYDGFTYRGDGLHWVIVGGESGWNARDCDPEWIRAIVASCKELRVPCFVKQLGTRARKWQETWDVNDRKGGNPAEWPADLRVREMPAVAGKVPA